MKNISIGKVELQFNENGKLQSSVFTPMLKINAGEELLNEYFKSNVQPNEMDVKLIGELTLSKFFSKITEIELSDREKYQIISETLVCDKYQNGKLKRCVLLYKFTNYVASN